MGMTMYVAAITESRMRRLLESPEDHADIWGADEPRGRMLDLHKSWHGLHFALTGTAWGSEPPLGLLLAGEPLEGFDPGHGPARLHRPEKVKEAAAALALIDDEDFAGRFDPEAMAVEEVYPSIWDEPVEDLLDEYASYFNRLRSFVQQAAHDGMALVILL